MSEQLPIPRRDLREPAFRKYEPYIARAITEDFDVNTGTQSADTFVARFNDAKLGYERYKYSSQVIPTTCDIWQIKATTFGEYLVRITNQKRQKAAGSGVTSLPTLSGSNVKVDGAWGLYRFYTPFTLPKDKDLILPLLPYLESGLLITGIKVIATTPTDVEWLDSLYNGNISVVQRGENTQYYEIFSFPQDDRFSYGSYEEQHQKMLAEQKVAAMGL